MKKNKINIILYVFILALIVSIGGCKKDKEVITPTDPDPVDPPVVESSEIDQFIWSEMNLYYLWYKNVPDLADNRFATNEDFYTFLNAYNEDHSALFDDLLYQIDVIDKWSWIVDDYVELENSFQGVSLSMGFEYGLVKYSNSDGIFGYVQYVVPGTPADEAGIKRGDLFVAIDEQDLDINNYRTLLFSRNSFEISFAEAVTTSEGTTITPNDVSIYLTAVEVHESPIHLKKVIETGGKKVGYLVYNAFRSNYDLDLNDVIGEFKSDGIQELILDFRYNGGGSVNTAAYLASMIYNTNEDEIFAITQYNDKLENYFRSEYGSDYFNYKFESGIAQETGADVPINTLNLSKVYIITTGGSASASELIINGLDPYIDVVLVGETTHGKYVGSFTIKDYDSNGIVNPNHTWALQPITLKIANSLGVSDFVNGFSPDFVVEEDILNLKPFGDVNEPMLKATLDVINGVPQLKSYTPSLFKKVADSKDLKPHMKEMYLEGDFRLPDLEILKK